MAVTVYRIASRSKRRSGRRRRTSVATVALFLSLGSLGENRAASGQDLREFRKSLLAANSVADLPPLEAFPDRGGAALTPLQRAYIQARRSVLLNSADDALLAERAFEDALHRSPRNPWAHLGLAELCLRWPLLRANGLGGVAGEAGDDRAEAELRTAIAADSGLSEAAVELLELANRHYDRRRLAGSVDIARAVLPHTRDTSALATGVAEAFERLDVPDSAELYARMGLASAHDSLRSAVTERELGIALLRQANQIEQGYDHYMAALQRATALSIDGFVRDIAPLLPASERLQFADGPAEVRSARIRAFWERSAFANSRTGAERLSEHFSRLYTARRKFLRPQTRGAPGVGASLASAADTLSSLDDRGAVWVRYGAPDEVIASHAAGARFNEIWLYRRLPAGPCMFAFVALEGASGFSLVDDVAEMVDAAGEGRYYRDLDRGNPQQSLVAAAAAGVNPWDVPLRILRDIAEADPRMLLLMSRMQRARTLFLMARDSLAVGHINSPQVQDLLAQVAEQQSERQREAAERHVFVVRALAAEDASPRFAHSLPFYFDVLTFRGDHGLTDVVIPLLASGADLQPQLGADAYAHYSVKASFVAHDGDGKALGRADSAIATRWQRPLGAGDFLRIALSLSLLPSTASFRVALSDQFEPGSGQVYGGTTRIRNYDGDSLMVSDLVLAQPTARGSFSRGGVQLALLPPREFGRKTQFRLYYEIYNMPVNASFRTEVHLEALRGDAVLPRLLKLGRQKQSMSLSFENTAVRSGVVQEARTIQADLSPGRYRLRVRVRVVGSETIAESSSTFSVAPKSQAAAMP